MSQATPVQISDFDPSLLPACSSSNISVTSGRDWSQALALLITACLHSLVIYSAASGIGLKKLQSSGAFANQGSSVVAPAEELILIAVEDTTRDKFDLAQQIASLTPKLKAPPISIISPDRLFITALGDPDVIPDDSSTHDEVDPTTRALMLHRYLDQINSRVEGAWVHPAEPATDARSTGNVKGAFNCRVQIRQDVKGNVQEVLLLKCGAAEAWQRSLVTAIYQASPLNAPPIPSVFSRALTMTFVAPIPDRGANDGDLAVR